MKMTADELKAIYKNDPAGTSRVLVAALREFGYPVSDQWVQDEIARLLADKEPTGGPSMFLHGWLKDGLQ